MRALDIAASGLAAQQLSVDTISQNLANMNTTGYKSARVEFQDLIYQDLKRVGTNTTDQNTIAPVGLQVGLGVKSVAVSRNTSQGSLTSTQNSLDVAINGGGYFQITMPDGTTSYTRDGSFKLGPTGQIVTNDGYTVLPGITIPTNATEVSINASGQVQVTIPGQTTASQVGQMQLASFVNPNGLQALGSNLYAETTASGTATTGNPNQEQFGSLQQGYLESSNVDSVSAVTDLVSAQRAYEMNTKVLQAADQMLQSLNQTA